MEGVLPERNHAVKFVAVYDNRTDSHAAQHDSFFYQAVNR